MKASAHIPILVQENAIPEKNSSLFNGEPMASDLGQHLASLNLYVESYGCQMNFSDSEIVASILQQSGYRINSNIEEADLIFLNTCSIREKAEQTIRQRLKVLNKFKQQKPNLLIGVLGCMAERLKKSLLEEEKIVDIVAGPDAYRTLPMLVGEALDGHRSLNVLLSREETYADIAPVRLDTNGVSAFVSIMRGCDNMCSFCVVPFTRGRERSRPYQSILNECKELSDKGYKEITLLGQNVDSYKFTDGTKTTNFAELLRLVAGINKTMRVRFSTSHPKDITDEVVYTMKEFDNICKYIHLPVQSGSSRVLELMNRTYTREWYLERVETIKKILPTCGLSTDVIAGFCTETEEEHQETLSLMNICRFDYAYMFAYSERPGTLAAKKLNDDVHLSVKQRRLQEIVQLQRQHAFESMQKRIGDKVKVLIEGDSKKSDKEWMGRTDQNLVAVFPKKGELKKGDYTEVFINDCTSATLKGEMVSYP